MKTFRISLTALMLVAGLALGVGPAPTAQAAATNVVLGGSVATLAGAQSSNSEQYLGSGSWHSILGDGKIELYIDPKSPPFDSLGSFTIADIKSFSYVTKNGGTPSNVDFYINIYTQPYPGGDATWYGNRLTAEPLYANNYNVPISTWNTWTTDSGTNQLTLFDSNHGPTGFYGAPTLADIQTGPIKWSDWVSSGDTTSIDYTSQTVKYIVLATGSAWASVFEGCVDALIIELNTGSSLTIDLEHHPSEIWVDDDWVGTMHGTDPDGAGPATSFGDDAFATIQEGIDAISGSTVNVAPGTYVEQIVIDKPLTLRGATYAVNKNGYPVPANYAWDDTVESIISAPDPFLNGTLVDITDTDDVTFEGFVVQSLYSTGTGGGGKDPHLLRVYAHTQTVDNVVVRNNVLGPNTNVDDQNGTKGRMGLYLAMPNYSDYDITNSLFTGNKIFDCKGNGNNVFVWGGAENYSSERGELTGTVIEDNEIYGSHRSGIEIAGSADDLTIRNNKIYSNSGLPTDDPTNLKYGNGILVIRMGSDKTSPTGEGPDNLTIADNEIYDNEKNGIYMGPMNSNHTLSGNVIRDNGWDGIRIDLEEQYYGGGYPVYDRTSNIVATNNSIHGNNLGAQVVGFPTNGFVLDASGNWWGTNTPASVAAEVSANVDYTPWLDSGTDTSADPGFQGDFSALHVDDDSPQTGLTGYVQEGIDMVSGSTVYVAAGTYNESLTIDKSLSVVGAGATDVFVTGGIQIAGSFDGLTLEGMYLTGDAPGYKNDIIDMRPTTGPVSNITIRNCVLDGENTADRGAFYGHYVAGDWTWEGNEIKNLTSWYLIDNTGSAHDVPYKLDTVTWANNHVHHVSGSVAIRGKIDEPTDLIVISDSTFDQYVDNSCCGGWIWAAIEINNASEVQVYRNTIKDVPQQDVEGEALQMWSASPWTVDIHDNEITGNYSGIWIWGLLTDDLWSGPDTPLYVPGGSIYRNNIFGNTSSGLWINDWPPGAEPSNAIGGPLDARCNWWGAVDGPAGVGPGSGDVVGNNILFDPWLLGPAPEGACGKPTAITLASFTAEPGVGSVTLAWETGTEIDNAGFNLYRATAEGGPYAKVNGALIAAEGDPVSGASYSFLDKGLSPGTYYYKLEDVDLAGVTTLHGPVSAAVLPRLRRPTYRPTLP